ncbi:MAG: hypothetical protein J5825_00800 [Lachnospiraceae bacterium]|nr:hypothetical protein [Lachnospiraceae bacterium]
MTMRYSREEAKEIRDVFRDALLIMKDMIAANDRDELKLMKEIDLRATAKADTLIRRLSVRSFSDAEYDEIREMIFVPLDSPEYPGDRKAFRKLLTKYQEGAEIADRCRTLQGLYGAAITEALEAIEPVADGSRFLFSSSKKNREKADRAYEELIVLKQNGFLEELDSMWKAYRVLHGKSSAGKDKSASGKDKTGSGKESTSREPASDRSLQDTLSRLHPGRINADRIGLPENLTNGVAAHVYERLAKITRRITTALEEKERLTGQIIDILISDDHSGSAVDGKASKDGSAAGKKESLTARFDSLTSDEQSDLLYLLAVYRKKEAYFKVAEKYRNDPYFAEQTFTDLEPMSDVMEWLRADDTARLFAYRAMENSETIMEDYRKESDAYDEYLKAADITKETALQDHRRNEAPYRELLERISETMKLSEGK